MDTEEGTTEYNSRIHGLWGDREGSRERQRSGPEGGRQEAREPLCRDSLRAHRALSAWHHLYAFEFLPGPFQTIFFMSFSRYFCGRYHFIILCICQLPWKMHFLKWSLPVAYKAALQIILSYRVLITCEQTFLEFHWSSTFVVPSSCTSVWDTRWLQNWLQDLWWKLRFVMKIKWDHACKVFSRVPCTRDH